MLNLSKYKHKDLPFSSWLYRIAYNEFCRYYDATKKSRIIDMDYEVLVDSIRAEEVISADLLHPVIESLQELTTEEIEIIEMRFYDQLPFKEIGEVLQITENYAKVRLYRTLDKLKKITLAKCQNDQVS